MDTKKRIFYLDLVRVFAMLCIVVYHFMVEAILNGAGNPGNVFFLDINGLNPGHYGVSLFLILSGAALMCADRSDSWKRFYVKRFRAIYPAYWLAWLGAFVLARFASPHKFDGVPLYRIFLTVAGLDGYLQAAVPTFALVGEWFVGLIVLIYLIFPMLRRGVRRHPALTVILVFCGYAAGICCYPFAKIPASQNFLMRIPDVLAGMLFMQYFSESSRLLGGLTGAGLAVLAYWWHPRDPQQELFRYLLSGIALFLILRMAASAWERVSRHRFIDFLGSVSYEIFLVHHIVLTGVFRLVYPRIPWMSRPLWFWLSFLPLFCLILAAAVVLNRLTGGMCRLLGAAWKKLPVRKSRKI